MSSNPAKFEISFADWLLTWDGLRERSGNCREALCVWAGNRIPGCSVITEVVFMDQFDGVEGFALFHRVSRAATNQLFQLLRNKGLELIADVHTHPAEWVGLSPTDMDHPLEYRVGFVSVVLPHYGAGNAEVGVSGIHEYIGSRRWRELSEDEKRARIVIGGY